MGLHWLVEYPPIHLRMGKGSRADLARRRACVYVGDAQSPCVDKPFVYLRFILRHPPCIPLFNIINEMSTTLEQNAAAEKAAINGTNGIDHAKARKPYDYGGNPLAHINTGDSVRLPAFGGEFQPGSYKSTEGRKFANPAPLGLSAFALTTFVLSLINVGTRGITGPSIVIGAAFAYGGLVQLLAGMWYVVMGNMSLSSRKLIQNAREMAVGNTFGATALSSYGGFWIGTAIILTPGGFQIEESLIVDKDALPFLNSFGLYLMVSANVRN